MFAVGCTEIDRIKITNRVARSKFQNSAPQKSKFCFFCSGEGKEGGERKEKGKEGGERKEKGKEEGGRKGKGKRGRGKGREKREREGRGKVEEGEAGER